MDPAMKRVRDIFKDSGRTLEEVGEAMGYSKDVARKAVWQFLRSEAPRIDVLRKFAKAMGVRIEELVAEKRKGIKPFTKESSP